MSIRSQAQFEKLRAIGRIVRRALDAAAAAVRPGIATAELDAIAARVLAEHGAESAPPKIHGIPGARVLCAGDLVKLDLVAEKEGFFADAALTVAAGDPAGAAQELVRCAESAFWQAARAATAGNRVCEIGRAVERETRRRGFHVMRELCGHGVGRAIHEPPSVPNYHDSRFRSRLTEGLVITIEPIVASGSGQGVLADDGWTIRTADGGWSAHYEHSLVITRGEPVLLTAA